MLQSVPVKPALQEHIADWKRSTQEPPALQQLKLRQSSMGSTCSQWVPNTFAGHVHLYDHSLPTKRFWQLPPFWHGLAAQLSAPLGCVQVGPPHSTLTPR